MRPDFSLNTVIYDTVNKNKTNAKPRFELSTDSAEPTKICYLHAEKARGTRASLVSRDVTMRQQL